MIVVLNLAWHVLIEEDKDNLLQFAKVFKLLKLPIYQNFPPTPFCAIQYISCIVQVIATTTDYNP